ncbi:MAG: hypothetical protein ACRDLD_15190 [Thermoleophilaceae bacterium]
MAEVSVQERLRRRPSACEPWLARAFGVELALHFEAPALRPAQVDVATDPTVLELVYASSLDAGWSASETQPLGWMPDGRGGALLESREHPELGVLFRAGVHGRYLIGPDARHVACAPPSVAEWYWQRMLVGQILPLVAALRELYVIHASAVSLGDRAIAIAGPPGAGKSTLAMELALAGHSLLAEDVVALRLGKGGVLAEPGVALVNLQPTDQARRLIEDTALPVLGRSHKIHVSLPRAARALPLSALYLLESADRGLGSGDRVETLDSPSAPDLIGTAFTPYLSGREYLLRHLEFAAALAGSAAVARVWVDRAVPPAQLAREIREHAESAVRQAA